MSADAPPAGEPLGVPDAVKQIERAVRAIAAEPGAAKGRGALLGDDGRREIIPSWLITWRSSGLSCAVMP
jgi:hypothetical protein